MPTTPAGIRYPSSGDSINIPQDLLNLATDVDTYVQAQVGSAATASNTLTFTNKTLTSPIINGDGVVFEGATADAYETTLTVVDPTADRTITLPNVTGTVITTGNLSDITDIGVFTGSITIEGTTADGFETTLAVVDPTADRTITFPNESGTVALQENIEIAVIMAAFQNPSNVEFHLAEWLTKEQQIEEDLSGNSLIDMNKTFTKINSSIGKKLNMSMVAGKSFKLKDFVNDTKNQILF